MPAQELVNLDRTLASTLAPRISCTGSGLSKTTNPKLGSFPPTPLVLIRSSRTFPYAAKNKRSYELKKMCVHFFFFFHFYEFKPKHTHEELFKLILINVMWEVANEKLVAVRVADNSPVVHVPRISLSSATCRTDTANKISSHEIGF